MIRWLVFWMWWRLMRPCLLSTRIMYGITPSFKIQFNCYSITCTSWDVPLLLLQWSSSISTRWEESILFSRSIPSLQPTFELANEESRLTRMSAKRKLVFNKEETVTSPKRKQLILEEEDSPILNVPKRRSSRVVSRYAVVWLQLTKPTMGVPTYVLTLN